MKMLYDIKNNKQIAKIRSIDKTLPKEEVRRLKDLGFVNGKEIRYLFSDILNETRAYAIMDTIVALRVEQTKKIFVCN